ncbi:hypothetical protein HJC23_004419 [Cyclotella cryptica]|uniref:Major facilitator superfamily (MFS) profile domain-containing protein n=1 Tax=Cyclotella cryptica TaxID=29204 RepID=A0ABD3QE37_9STRA|eukprot:CCRYP_006022-RA/>CCRYP_006022-RA protein AED:0.01 eAED:0.01 QI:1599/1/1/1/0/0/3/206/690
MPPETSNDGNEPPQPAQDHPAHPTTQDNETNHSTTHNGILLLPLLHNAIRNPDQLTAMISNYSTSYNAVNVGIVLPVLKYAAVSSPAHEVAATAAADAAIEAQQQQQQQLHSSDTSEQDALVASSLLGGMIVGQLLGGYLGDAIGRRNAMLFVMLLQIGASLGGAWGITANEDDSDGGDGGGWTTLEQLAMWRFILGIGAGGVYPLAAVMSAENQGEEMEEEEKERGGRPRSVDVMEGSRREYEPASVNDSDPYLNESAQDETLVEESDILSFQRVALTFSMQGLGFVTVPLLAYPLLALHVDIDLVWRLLLGLGAVPGLFVMYLRLFRRNRKKAESSNTNGGVEICDEAVVRQRSEGGSLELTPPTSEEELSNGVQKEDPEDVTFQSTVTALLNDIVDGDPSVHITQQDQQLALVDNSHLDSDNDEYEGFHDESDAVASSVQQHSPSLWSSIKNEPHLAKKLAGTAGTWFLFDALYYGNTLFEPVVLEAAFGSKDNVEDGYTLLLLAVRDSLMISLLALPGYFVTVILIGRRTCVCQSLRTKSTPSRCNLLRMCSPCTQMPAYIQMQGFLVMFLLYLIIGIYWTALSSVQWLLLVLYAGTFFFANYGPNSTTFLLPSVTYSKECRSTLNGMSAAAGKLGALMGASVFEPAANEWGANVVMVACAIISVIGFTLTKFCVGGYQNVGSVPR